MDSIMLSKILGLRRVLASVVNPRRYHQHGKLSGGLSFSMAISMTRHTGLYWLVNSIYQPIGGKVLGGHQVLVTPIRHYRCDAHMNELPVPCCPWEPWYSDKQSFYNKVLLGGILWFLFSLGMMIYTDSIFLNWGPPKTPGPPSDMVEECED